MSTRGRPDTNSLEKCHCQSIGLCKTLPLSGVCGIVQSSPVQNIVSNWKSRECPGRTAWSRRISPIRVRCLDGEERSNGGFDPPIPTKTKVDETRPDSKMLHSRGERVPLIKRGQHPIAQEQQRQAHDETSVRRRASHQHDGPQVRRPFDASPPVRPNRNSGPSRDCSVTADVCCFSFFVGCTSIYLWRKCPSDRTTTSPSRLVSTRRTDVRGWVNALAASSKRSNGVFSEYCPRKRTITLLKTSPTTNPGGGVSEHAKTTECGAT